MMSPQRVILAVTGASGAIYPERLLKALLEGGHGVELVISPYGARLLKEERDLPGDPRSLVAAMSERYGLSPAADQVVVHNHQDQGASIASGTYPVRGMVIVPASLHTVGAIAAGLGGNLIERAAAVTLKERRPLVVVPRETPLNRIQLENLLRIHDAGATVLPADPGFYQQPKTFEDLGDFIAARILDQLRVDPGRDLVPRWDPRGTS